MPERSERGVAYNFWLRVKTEQATRGWNDVELQRQSGIPRGTTDRLKVGKRPPQPRIVNALADALGIDRDEALSLARITPPGTGPTAVSAREAIEQDPMFNEDQRETMLRLLDMIEQANQAGRQAG
ncbi:helix-turn-helix domain-containing protein [Polymorphospora rubra]|nr:helix-turn-helix transcriptional regulator [Polymorphospora rubra]